MDIEAIAGQVAAEWQMGFGGIELDFALEVAKRAVLAEREDCAVTAEIFDFNDRQEIEAPKTLPKYVAAAIRQRSNVQGNRPPRDHVAGD